MEVMIPYQNLYSYEISGEILGSRSFFEEDFIGCWNGGEATYLFLGRMSLMIWAGREGEELGEWGD
jgi:hypothetical protein